MSLEFLMPSRCVVVWPTENQQASNFIGGNGIFPFLSIIILGLGTLPQRCLLPQKFPKQSAIFVGVLNGVEVVQVWGFERLFGMVGGLFD